MHNNHTLFQRFIAFLLVLSMTLLLAGCGSKSAPEQEVNKSIAIDEPTASPLIATESIANQITEDIQFIEELKSEDDLSEIARSLIINEYSLYYDVFTAAVVLDDGTEIPGIGYSDFGAYFASEDGSRNYFPAGFLPNYGEMAVPDDAIEKGLVVYNLDYEDDSYGFVYSYGTTPFLEHCVINGNYLKYGVEQSGVITYESQPYERGYCDENLGALYSFDENRYVFNPDVGEYVSISGTSLFESLDYDALEKEINQILASQDYAFSQEEIRSTVYFAREAVESYLLSFQQETFMGYDVDLLVAEVQSLDPTEFIRFTPEGYIVIPIEEDIPDAPSDLAKWLVGASCGIVVIGSTALSIFVPAARPVSGAITGAAIDVFMQVVVENRSVSGIQWSKVAVAAVSGALMAWACPLGASAVTSSVGKAGGSIALSKLAGYGVLTLSNAFVSGTTNAAFALIDGKTSDDVWDAFLIGAAIGACCTAAASILSEIAHPIGNTLSNALNSRFPNNFLSRAGNDAATFIGNHQVHLFDAAVEDILNPKSVYVAAQAAHDAYLQQLAEESLAKGGRYADLATNGMQRHEMPSFSSTGAEVRRDGPSIRMTAEDHRLTASYGSSIDAQVYQARQRELIQAGNYHDAIQMDLDDIYAKFGHKYDEHIEQMLAYAESIGWW